MPKNGSKSGKSSKTARVLSLLTDPLRGGSRGHTEEEYEAEEVARSSPPPQRGLDDAATESRIQASLAAEEDSLIENLFGKKEPSRARQGSVRKEGESAAASAVPFQAPPVKPDPSAPPTNVPQGMEDLFSVFDNPSTLGNPSLSYGFDYEDTGPISLGKDFADDLVAGMGEQPESVRNAGASSPMGMDEELELMTRQRTEPPAPEPAPQAYQQPEPQPAPQTYQQPAPQAYQQPEPQTYQQPAPQAYQQPEPQPAPQAYQQPAPQAAPQTYQQPAPQAAPQTYQQPAPQAAPQTYQQPAPHQTKPDHEEFVCFNLTQALVEDKADKLMKQFGMCTCNRCKVDVTAIALSNLPAKYVAMQNRDILPLLSMYEEKYSAAVTVQVMSACRMVMDRPHHGRRS